MPLGALGRWRLPPMGRVGPPRLRDNPVGQLEVVERGGMALEVEACPRDLEGTCPEARVVHPQAEEVTRSGVNEALLLEAAVLRGRQAEAARRAAILGGRRALSPLRPTRRTKGVRRTGTRTAACTR